MARAADSGAIYSSIFPWDENHVGAQGRAPAYTTATTNQKINDGGSIWICTFTGTTLNFLDLVSIDTANAKAVVQATSSNNANLVGSVVGAVTAVDGPIDFSPACLTNLKNNRTSGSLNGARIAVQIDGVFVLTWDGQSTMALGTRVTVSSTTAGQATNAGGSPTAGSVLGKAITTPVNAGDHFLVISFPG